MQHNHYEDPDGPDEYSPQSIFGDNYKTNSMKKRLTALKNKLRRLWQWIAGQSIMIWHWFKNLFFVFLTSKSEPRIFQGYGHWWFAKKYADKRAKMSKINKVAGGKRHYVLPFSEYSLIVVNHLEINFYKKTKMFKKSLNINEVLKHAYYITK